MFRLRWRRPERFKMKYGNLARYGIDANERLGQLLQTGCPTFECENFYSASVSIFRKFCHQRSESFFSNGFPSISLVSDCVKSQDVPASGSHPFGNSVVSRNLAAVQVESIKGSMAWDDIIGLPGTSPCLLVASNLHSISKVVMRAVVRIAKDVTLVSSQSSIRSLDSLASGWLAFSVGGA